MTRNQYGKIMTLLARIQIIIVILAFICALALSRHTGSLVLGTLVGASFGIFVTAIVLTVLEKRRQEAAERAVWAEHVKQARIQGEKDAAAFASLIDSGVDPDKMAEHVQATHNDDETRG